MLNNVLFILLGAGFVTVGFIAAAFAERIRGARAMETPARPETRGQERRTPALITNVDQYQAPPWGVAACEPAEMPRTPTVTRATRSTRATRQAAPSSGDDVIAALMTAGYKRAIAAEATWGCGEAERTTIEHWTASALRRCGREGLS